MSGLARVEACGGELVLPQTREEESAECSYGSVVHAFLRDVSALGLEKALAAAPEEHREALEGVDVAALPACKPDQYAVEVAFAYDWKADKARELFRGRGNRDYSSVIPDCEIPGTSDVVGTTADAVIIFDYKSLGYHLPKPGESLQLQGYALAAARAYGKSKAIVGFIRRLDGDPIYATAELDELDLDAAAARIRAVMERPALAVPDGLRQGGHCTYCPSFGACPLKTALLRGILADDSPAVLSAETAPQVFERLLLAEEVLGKVRSTIEEWARSSPIALPDGQVYGPTPGNEKLDPEKARPVLVEAYGEEVAKAAIVEDPKLTKKGLSSALKLHMKANPGLKISKLEQAALELLRAGGAVSRGKDILKVHTLKPALPAGGAKP